MISRAISEMFIRYITDFHKVIILYGARQVGKTTLIKVLGSQLEKKVLYINADQKKYQDVLSSQDLDMMDSLIGDHDVLFIDEAQNIKNIGINLKLLHDERPNLKIIATGSSSFELANQIKEPLTGRTITLKLYPISVMELRTQVSDFDIKDNLESYLLYGMYPEVLGIIGANNKINHLRELASAYLYKDILQLSNIKHSDKLYKLLQLLAFQIGNLVSVHEIAKHLGLSQDTVSDYIDLLEKGFILTRLSGLSKNPHKEISKMDKIYFNDLGIRNLLIENFNPLELRQDTGAIWENFLFIERQKFMEYTGHHANIYFWRLYSGAELDYVEEHSGRYDGYEFKWGGRKSREPKSWLSIYDQSHYTQINRDNWMQFVVA